MGWLVRVGIRNRLGQKPRRETIDWVKVKTNGCGKRHRRYPSP
jgi:hypothetical protein